MRVALIADLHGNQIALEAVLADLRQQAVDALVCLGDVATIGPQPTQVIATLRDQNCVCIMGNHDAALLDLDRALALRIAPPLIPSLHWCAARLTPDDFAFLRAFQPTHTLALDAALTALCFHGSPRSNTENILATTPGEELDRHFAERAATAFIGGHTHIQMLRQHNGKLIINAGSVGCPFAQPAAPNVTPTIMPWAEYALIDSSAGRVSVDLRRVAFDLAAYQRVLTASDLPIRDWWLAQYATEKS